MLTVSTEIGTAYFLYGGSDYIPSNPEDTENLAILTADGTSPTRAIRHALEIVRAQ